MREVFELDELAVRDLADEQLVERHERRPRAPSRARGRAPPRSTPSAADRRARRAAAGPRVRYEHQRIRRRGEQRRRAHRRSAPRASRFFGCSATTSPRDRACTSNRIATPTSNGTSSETTSAASVPVASPTIAIERERRHHREQRDRDDEHADARSSASRSSRRSRATTISAEADELHAQQPAVRRAPHVVREQRRRARRRAGRYARYGARAVRRRCGRPRRQLSPSSRSANLAARDQDAAAAVWRRGVVARRTAARAP